MSRLNLRDQSGFTLIELCVSMIAFIAVFTAIMMMITVATRNQDRISQRVAANQRARPVMQRITNNLHSACVAPRVAPIAPGSTSTSMTYIAKSGDDVTPVPDRRVLTLSGTTLSEAVYPATGGAAPSWTFSGTSSSNTSLMTNVSAPGGVAFRYYDYVGGALNPTPLPVPLTAANAARAAHVSVTLSIAPARGVSNFDTKSPITLSDSVDLRLESASQTTGQDNLPCT